MDKENKFLLDMPVNVRCNKFSKNNMPPKNSRIFIFLDSKLCWFEGEYREDVWVLYGMPPGHSQVDPYVNDYWAYGLNPPIKEPAKIYGKPYAKKGRVRSKALKEANLVV